MNTGNVYTFGTHSAPVQFSRKYDTLPVVSVALQDAQWHDDKWSFIRLDAVGLTTEGFSVRCAIYRSTDQYIDHVRVRWTATPAAL